MGAHVDKLRASSTGLRALLSGRDWIYLLSLLGPLVVYNLALKLVFRNLVLPGYEAKSLPCIGGP